MSKMLQTHKLIKFTGARAGLASARRETLLRQQRANSISTWERVRSSMWHPMATVEQSLMDMKHLTSQLVSDRAFPRNLFQRARDDEDDFFRDLDVSSAKDVPKPSAAKAKSAGEGGKEQQLNKRDQNSGEGGSGLTYSVYSFSSSTVLDADGRRVSTVRRRYEDSTGRLKALHEREIDGKKVKSVWRREHPDDKGEHHVTSSGGSSEDFEEKWKQTPFGQAESGQQEQQQLREGKSEPNKGPSKNKGQGESHKSEAAKLAEQDHHKKAFGADYDAAEVAPHKECDDAAHTKEAREFNRKDAIAEGSKRQEEETTPPSYS